MPLTIDEISYTYQSGSPWERRALKRVSFSLERGEILGINGPAGTGKSTLLLLMAGLLPFQQGRMLVEGQMLDGKKKKAGSYSATIGLVGQIPEKQLFERTVYKDIAFGPENLGIDKKEIPGRVQQAMQDMGLSYDQFKDRSPLSLSTGEKRRVAIAGILALQPDYLLLDEPSAGLDSEGRQELFKQLAALRNQARGLIMVSHRLDELLLISDRLLVLEEGTVKYLGPTLEILEKMELDQGHPGLTPGREVLKQLQLRGFNISMDMREPEQLARAIIKSLKEDRKP